MATVLVVDDQRDLCELIRVSLELDGHDVMVAYDGEGALSAIRRSRPDVVILDVMMPGQDGFSVLGAMKAGESAEIPVLMLTAREDAMDRIRGGIEGAVSYLTKPFSVVALRETVEEILGGGVAEPALRRRALTEAMAELARIEAGRPGSGGTPARPGAAHPRLTRYEPSGAIARRAKPASAALEDYRAVLTARQSEILDAVLAAPSIAGAAEVLDVSRTYLYASLRRIARKVGAASGPELVRTLRPGGGHDDR